MRASVGDAARRVGLGQVLDDVAHLRLGDVGELHERPPAGPVGGDLGLVQPATVDVAEQVVLRTDVGVHARAGVVENAHGIDPNRWSSRWVGQSRTRTTDLPRVRRCSMSASARPNSSNAYVAPIGGLIDAGLHHRQEGVPLLVHVARPDHRVGAPADAAHVDVVEQQPVHLDLGDALAAGEADDEQPALRRQGAQRVGEHVAADHVEHDVDAPAAGQLRARRP